EAAPRQKRLRWTPPQVAHRRSGKRNALEREHAVSDRALHLAARDLHLIRKRRVRAKSRECRNRDRHHQSTESLPHRVDTSPPVAGLKACATEDCTCPLHPAPCAPYLHSYSLSNLLHPIPARRLVAHVDGAEDDAQGDGKQGPPRQHLPRHRRI